MLNLKYSIIWASVGVILSAVLFWINWFYGPISFYRIVFAPGNLAASFFIHEIPLATKLTILLTGQFIFCLIASLVTMKYLNYLNIKKAANKQKI